MRTVLLIEDEPLLKNLYAQLLGRLRCRVVTAEEELAALRAFRASRPQLVILDLIIPSRSPRAVDATFHNPIGYRVLKTLRRLAGRERLKIIVLSNLDSDEHRSRCFALGADDYWVKANLPPREFLRLVDAVLVRP